MRTVACIVAGQPVDRAFRTVEIRDPADPDRLVATVPSLERPVVEAAIDAAVAAQQRWMRRPVTERAAVLRDAGERLSERRKALTEDLIAEGGKTTAEAEAEAAKAIDTFHYYAGLAAGLDGRAFGGGAAGLRHETRREPIGVVAAITPWNVPAAAPARKLAPALLAGNSVIVKPATLTPLSAHHLVEALLAAGVGDGVVQLVVAQGSVFGEAIAAHRGVDAVSFTGSTKVGLDLQASLARTLTRLQLELGGKNAAIVLPDADLDNAVGHIVRAAFAAAGQQCTATSRVLVDRAVSRRFGDKLLRAIQRLVVGDPRDPRTDVGPLISRSHLESVAGFVRRAENDGAIVVTGGTALDRPGNFFPPTALGAVTPSMEVAREEVFGPVLSVIDVSGLDEAIKVANDTDYGLSAAVHTSDIAAAEAAVAAIDCGVVAVNGPTAGIELAAPFGGFKMSGTAWKEHGAEALSFYTRTKLASRYLPPGP